MKLIKFIIMLLVISSMSGLLISCLSPVKIVPQSSYIINKVPPPIITTHKRSSILLVLPPATVPAFNTTQMAYRLSPYQIAYFGENRWAETPAEMLKPLIIQALQNTQHYRGIVTPPYMGSQYDYILTIQILELIQDFQYKIPLLRITLHAQLSSPSNRLIKTQQFTIIEPLSAKTPYAGVIAANEATARLLNQLVLFCLKNTN